MSRIHMQSFLFGFNTVLLCVNLNQLVVRGGWWSAFLIFVGIVALTTGWFFMGEEAKERA